MISHGIIYFLFRVANGILAVAAIFVFTRLLTAQQYGAYALATAIISISSAILFQWLNVATGRFYPSFQKTPEVVMPFIRRAFRLVSAGAAVIFLVMLFSHQTLGFSPIILTLMFVITLAQGRYDLSLKIVNSQGRPLKYGMMACFKSSLLLISGSLIILSGFKESGALLGLLIGLLGGIVISTSKHNRHYKGTYLQDFKASQLYRYGLPFSLGFLAIASVNLSDRILIGWILGAASVAPYAATYDIVQQSIGSIMNVLLLASFPSIVKNLSNEKIENTHSRLRALASAYFAIGLTAAIGISALSNDIITVLLGANVREGAEFIIPVLAVAIFISGFKSFYVDLSFQLSYKVKWQSYIAVFMAILNIILNILLIPRYGVLGAAWSTFASFSFGLFLSWKIGMKYFRLPFIGIDFYKVIFSALVMALCLMAMPPVFGIIGLLIKIAAGFGIYMGLSIILNISGCRVWACRLVKSRHICP